MKNSEKSNNTFFYLAPKAQPLTLKEVLQLRDGREITRNPNSSFLQTMPLHPLLQNINHPNSLN